jgi:hypothetical protein
LNSSSDAFSIALRSELLHIEKKLGLSTGLKIVYAPNKLSDFHGEVVDNIIYIYNEVHEDAIKTLRHEVLEYILKQYSQKPLLDWINIQNKIIQDLIYTRNEELVDRLVKLLD